MKWVTALFSTQKSITALLLPFGLLAMTGCTDENPVRSDRPNSKWISQIIEYRPAPGQFINTSLGRPDVLQNLVGGRGGILSLGGYGGYITFTFDHDVYNIEGPDFVIFGNAFDGNSEPGIVTVSQDGETWYELKGSEYRKPETRSDYRITYRRPAQTQTAEAIGWTDNRGEEGILEVVSAHSQCYYPLFPDREGAPTLTFTGSLLAPNSVFEHNQYDQKPYDWGYADNFSADYKDAVGEDPDTRHSNKFDIGHAVDGAGVPVQLEWVRQIKVYTATRQHIGAGVGESSTEFGGALSLSASR